MKNFTQTYRTIISVFFLGVFLSVFIVDFSCYLNKNIITKAEGHEHTHDHSKHGCSGHGHSEHKSQKIKVKKNINTAMFYDNSCCNDETSNFYSSVSKVVVSKYFVLDHQINIIIEPIFGLEVINEEIELSEYTSICNKAPPPLFESIYLINETFII